MSEMWGRLLGGGDPAKTGARAGTKYGMEPPMFGKCRRHVVMRHIAKTIAFIEVEHPELGPADAGCARQHCLEHRLQLARRAADDLQDLRGRGLLLQRLAQLARARLHLVKQPRVFDGDHRLVGKGGEQPDLLLRERLDLGAYQRNDADRVSFSQKWHAEHSSISSRM
jgi:hypothetical protein